jgi:Na+/H+-dicarboxylate symporter
MEDAQAQQAIRSILLKSQEDRLKFSRKGGVNHARILVGCKSADALLDARRADPGAVVWPFDEIRLAGGVFRGCSAYLLNPVKTMFMNALKINHRAGGILLLVSCVSSFKDLAELGRIAAKVMGMYLMTTVIAVLLALGISTLLRPGEFGFALSSGMEAETVSVNANADTSILSMIVGIVPNNIVRPFLESDTLQIIFLAVLCGIAVGMIGKYAPVLQDFFEACNSLFLTITTIISRFIPLAVFCSAALMMFDLGGASLLPVLGFAGTELLAIACMLAVYALLILVLAKLSPFTFFPQKQGGMLTSFTLCSSSARCPQT